jgi:pyruvate/2-oxoglutarate dehydrogenase complex dihydrolipoamide dehydrogenase (E3) component
MNNIWLIGAGSIAVEHARVMAALGVDFTVIGRGERPIRCLNLTSALHFQHARGID